MSTTLADFVSVNTSVTVELGSFDRSKVITSFTDSIRTRHHFEMFLADLARQTANCSDGISLVKQSDFSFSIESFRPTIPVYINGIEGWATLIEEIRDEGFGPSEKYAVNIRLPHSPETNELSRSIGLLVLRPGSLLFSGVKLDLTKPSQSVEAEVMYES